MDFRLSSEQEMLRDTARRFVQSRLDFDSGATGMADRAGDWAAIAEMGWLMLPVPGDCDGLGGGAEDIAIVAEELGRGVAGEPFIEGAVLPAHLINLAGSNLQRKALLPLLATGDLRFAAALYEPGRGSNLRPQGTQLTVTGDTCSLSGTKLLAAAGQHADHLIISAQRDGVAVLCVVDPRAPGVSRRDYSAVDGRSFTDFAFDAVELAEADILGGWSDKQAVLDEAIDHANVGSCADALGNIDKALELTAAYLQIRRQFGKSLADFQALQHGMANLFIEAMDARSIVYAALSKLDAPAGERRAAVAACKIKVSEAARTATGMAVHYHGGIGITTEYEAGRHLQRALVFEQMFGNSQHHFQYLLK